MKKFISILIALLMLTASVFCFSGCDKKYNYKEGDFRLIVSTNIIGKVKIGERIKLIATLENLSGRDIIIESFSKK